MKSIEKAMILRRILVTMLICILLPSPTLADNCPHTNVDRSFIETYESTHGNNSTHELACWMQTICLDCMTIISDVQLLDQKEPHWFVGEGVVLTCVWCEYSIKKPTLANAAVGDHITFGTYEQDNNMVNGKEDIEWLVLAKENNRLLVISRYALDCKPYNTKEMDVTWETCTLRKWLNKDFLNAAFSRAEQEMIPTVLVSADKNPYSYVGSGNATQDKVFLMSFEDFHYYIESEVGFSGWCEGTAYAKNQGVDTHENGTCDWWARTTGDSQSKALYIVHDGIFVDGRYVDNTETAIRPVMWINIPD